MEPAIAAQDIRRERAAFEPALEGSIGTEYTNRPLNTREMLSTGIPGAAGEDFKERTNNYTLGLAGKLWTGAEYDLSFKSNRFANDLNSTSLISIYYPEYDSFAGLTLTQPLLKGGGIDSNMTAVNLAKANERIAFIQRNRKVEEIALEVTLRYCDLAFAQNEIKVRSEAVRLAESLASDHEKRMKQGTASEVEILEARLAAATRVDELELGITRMIEVQSELVKAMGTPDDGDPGRTPLPVSSGMFFPAAEAREKLISTAVMNRLDYREAKIGIEKQDIEIRYARNQKWPQLDMTASCGVLGLNSSMGGALSRASTGDNPFWSAGITLTIPLGGNEAGARLDAARLKKAQALMALKKIEQEIVVDVETQLRILGAHRRRMNSARTAVEFAGRMLAAEEKKMDNGLTTGFAILEAQKNLTTARTQELSAINDFNKSAAKLSYVTGSLLQDAGFEISE